MQNNDLIKEIFSHFKKMQTVFLATCSDDKPFVRPMLLLHVDDAFWMATGANDAKTPQLRSNPNVGFCYLISDGDENGSIRGSGHVEFIEDMEIRKRFINNFSYIRHYWQDPEDPSYILLKLHIDMFEYMRPGEEISAKVQF